MSKDIVVCSTVRSAIAGFGGSGASKAVISLRVGGGQGIAPCLERG